MHLRQLVHTIVLALGCAALAAGMRYRLDSRVFIPGRAEWVTSDPDGLYHVRRLRRLVEEGAPVAAHDPALSYPEGAAIPWPPYYTYCAFALVTPFAPQEAQARADYLERACASLPWLFGSLSSLVAALAGAALAGPWAALWSGLGHALCFGSIAYSRLGLGDHHAFLSLLAALLWLTLSRGLERKAWGERQSALRYGLVAGTLMGVMLGSWVASVFDLLLCQVLIGIGICLHARRAQPGLASFGTSFHVACLAALAPALWASPWRETHPWIVVNLSYFHALELALGALVCWLLPPGHSTRSRHYPLIVITGLIVLALALAWLPVGPAAGLREGFAWLSRENQFMATIAESRPLVGTAAGPGLPLVHYLGFGALVFPLAWCAMVYSTWRARNLSLLPWVLSSGLFYAQALGQRRFADAAAVPCAVVLAWAMMQLLTRCRRFLGTRSRATLCTRAAAGVGTLLCVFAHYPGSLRACLTVRDQRNPSNLSAAEVRTIGARLAYEWVRDHTPAPADYAVLAQWAHGHGIEAIAERPSVATNFGTYVGVEAFLDATRFLFCTTAGEGEEILAARRVRYVYVESEWPSYATVAMRKIFPERFSATFGGEGEGVRDAFFDTLGARLLFGGGRAGGGEQDSLDYLRLIYVSPVPDPEPVLRQWGERWPSGFLYEAVPGAQVSASAAPGALLHLEIRLQFAQPGGFYPLVWRGSGRAGEDGVARVRVPYATEPQAGEQRSLGPARWRLGSKSGELHISEEQVREGLECPLPR